MITTALVERDRTRVHVCLDTRAAVLAGKSFRRVQESPSVTLTLKIITNRHAPKRSYCVGQVDSDDSCRRLANPKEEWIVT